MEPIFVTTSDSIESAAHLADGVQVVEAGPAHMEPIGYGRTVAVHEEAQLALAAFDAVIDHAGRHLQCLRSSV